MWRTRRTTLLVSIVLLGHSAIVDAQSYPTKPVRIITGSPASGADVLIRAIVTALGPVLGQQVVLEYRPGAAGIIATELAKRAPPDGYTFLHINIAQAAGVSLYKKLPYDLMRDFSAVTQLAGAPHAVVVHPSLPAKSLKELVALAKAKPGAINYGCLPTGASSFLAVELLRIHTGMDMVRVTYKGGGEAVTAVVAGEISLYVPPLGSVLPFIQNNRLRALAVTTADRLPSLPGIPTVVESGYPGYTFSNWYGLLAPAKTPKDAITTFRSAIVTVLKNPDLNKHLSDLGYIPVGDEPEAFSAYLNAEIDKLAKLVKTLNLATEGP